MIPSERIVIFGPVGYDVDSSLDCLSLVSLSRSVFSLCYCASRDVYYRVLQ